MITLPILRRITRSPDEVLQPFVAPLQLTLDEFGIAPGLELAAFLAQIAHESGGLRRTGENLHYTTASRVLSMWPSKFDSPAQATPYLGRPEALACCVYANRLGNGDAASGDGWRYRGRGLIQITGKANYDACLRDIYGSPEADPDRLLDADGAARSAGWYWWKTRCGPPATRGDFAAVTRLINGRAMAGQPERLALYARAKEALGIR